MLTSLIFESLSPPPTPLDTASPPHLGGRGGGRGWVRAVKAVVVGLYAIRVWVRNWDWRHREAFYGAMIRSFPDNPKAHYGYGNVVINDPKRKELGEYHMLRV